MPGDAATAPERRDPATRSSEPPLCVDLDGTLLAGDSLRISLRRLFITRPWRVPAIVCSMRRGRAWFKKRVADAILPDPNHLPYRPQVVAFLTDEHQSGRRLIMVTAADQRIGQLVADYLGIFTAVIGSDGRANVKGIRKLNAIREHLGDAEFDYAGDSMVDLVILRAARRAILVHPSPALVQAARASCRVDRVLE
jgi:phosphoserine phosphatase